MDKQNKETWVKVKDHPDYEINKEGVIRRIDTKELLNRSYPSVEIPNGRHPKRVYLHRLLAEAFLDKPQTEERLVVNHKDGNKFNFHLDNLEWVTQSQNMIHAYHSGRRKPAQGENMIPVVGRNIATKEVRTWPGIRMAARAIGADSTSITNSCTGKRTVVLGWQFMYESDYKRDGFRDVKPISRFNKKPVQQIDPHTNKVIAEFESAREAAQTLGINFSKICAVAKGKRKSTGGYSWKYSTP